MSQPEHTRLARCPDCKRKLILAYRAPADGNPGDGFYRMGEIVEQRPVFTSMDRGAALLWVRTTVTTGPLAGTFEEIMRNSASGDGPDGGAIGSVECSMHGELDVDALCGIYESKDLQQEEKK